MQTFLRWNIRCQSYCPHRVSSRPKHGTIWWKMSFEFKSLDVKNNCLSVSTSSTLSRSLSHHRSTNTQTLTIHHWSSACGLHTSSLWQATHKTTHTHDNINTARKDIDAVTEKDLQELEPSLWNARCVFLAAEWEKDDGGMEEEDIHVHPPFSICPTTHILLLHSVRIILQLQLSKAVVSCMNYIISNQFPFLFFYLVSRNMLM